MDDESVLLGEIREFKRATIERLSSLDAKVESLHAFRAKISGAMVVTSFLITSTITMCVEVYRAYR